MILSVSRRTDIPAFYMEWFCRRLREGEVYSANPMNPHQISRIQMNPENMDGIVFWSKNPEPMLSHLSELNSFPYYIQYTCNAYGQDTEPGLPSLARRLDTFFRLSEALGAKRVIWRYDPVFLSRKYSVQWYLEQFEQLAEKLEGITEQCVFSFLDYYRNTGKRMETLGLRSLNKEEMNILAAGFSAFAEKRGMRLCTCAERLDLSAYRISHGKCVDSRLLEEISGRKAAAGKDRNQRPECGCDASVDIGVYRTCSHGCLYCYASGSRKTLEANLSRYRENSPVLCRGLTERDVIKDRA